MSTEKYPPWYTYIKKTHGKFIDSLEQLGEVVRREGPLDEKTSQLVQLAAAAAIRSSSCFVMSARPHPPAAPVMLRPPRPLPLFATRSPRGRPPR
jgi:hypothetical protein